VINFLKILKMILYRISTIQNIKILITCLLFFSFRLAHENYISVTEINYVQDENVININTRLFGDDLAIAISKEFNESLRFDNLDGYYNSNRTLIEKYLTEKLIIKVNHAKVDKELIDIVFDNDIVKCYYKINNVGKVQSLEISNISLFELIREQQNIIRTDIYTKKQSYIQTQDSSIFILNF